MSKDLLYELIEALTILPGVGKKSAQRMALFLLDKNKDGALHLAQTLEECLDAIQRCEVCRQLTSEPVCRICSDQSRDAYSFVLWRVHQMFWLLSQLEALKADTLF